MADYEYQLDGELIVIPVHLFGKTTNYSGMFVLDTGSSGIVIDHEVALDMGYAASDGVGFSTVSSAVGKEAGRRRPGRHDFPETVQMVCGSAEASYLSEMSFIPYNQ